jgi:hypothetical protein
MEVKHMEHKISFRLEPEPTEEDRARHARYFPPRPDGTPLLSLEEAVEFARCGIPPERTRDELDQIDAALEDYALEHYLLELGQRFQAVYPDRIGEELPEAADEITYQGEVFYRKDRALDFLGVCLPALRRWSHEPCPYMPDGKRVYCFWRNTRDGMASYYRLADLQAVKEALGRGRPTWALGPGEIDLDEVARRTGLSPHLLLRKSWQKVLGLEPLYRPAIGADGRTHRFLGFRAEQVDALVNGTAHLYLTDQEAARLTGLSVSRVSALCGEGKPFRRFRRYDHALYIFARDVLDYCRARPRDGKG